MDKQENLIPAICPQCGASIQVDNSLEVGYCNYCGTKIIIKDVIQKVKIINNPTFENYIKIADRAYEGRDYEKALENYKKALEINPDDWKVNYREGICVANTTNLERFDIDKAVLGTKNAIKLMNEQKIEKKEIAQNIALMATDLIDLCKIFSEFTMNHYNEFWKLEKSAEEMWTRIIEIKNVANYIVNELLTDEVVYEILKNENDEKPSKNLKLLAMKLIVDYDIILCTVRKFTVGTSDFGDINSYIKISKEIRNECVEEYDKYVALIKNIEPNYEPIKINRSGKAGGCYVATYVYGSYDCPSVWVLRRYRDYKLSKYWYGRMFINIYYFISPKMISIFGDTKWFKKIFRKKLDKLVSNLEEKGYDNTPYKDKEW